MAMSNAEKQAAWRARRKAELEALLQAKHARAVPSALDGLPIPELARRYKEAHALCEAAEKSIADGEAMKAGAWQSIRALFQEQEAAYDALVDEYNELLDEFNALSDKQAAAE